jgi:hypothetical protein
LLIPLEAVKCGDVPEPRHDTTPDHTQLDDCQPKALRPSYALEIGKLHVGFYHDVIDHIPVAADPRRQVPVLYYHKPLEWLKSDVGNEITDAVFIGRNVDGIPVVTFVDMVVVSYDKVRGIPRVVVRFTSDPCSFDAFGHAVFVSPRKCVETLPNKGLETELKPLPATLPTPRKAPTGAPAPPVAPPSTVGTGSGSRAP